MAKIRHEEQRYANSALLAAETIVPTKNDVVYIESLNRQFRWMATSTSTHDGQYVIQQTGITTGRWIYSGVAKVYNGLGSVSALENGQAEEIEVTVTGCNLAKPSMVAVTNGDVMGDKLVIVSKEITANNTVTIVIENQSGDTTSAFTLNIVVLEF